MKTCCREYLFPEVQYVQYVGSWNRNVARLSHWTVAGRYKGGLAAD